MHLSQFITLTLTLTLSFQASIISAGSDFRLGRRVSMVDPGTNVDFKSTSDKEPTCKVPCKALVNLSDCASTDYDCTYKALCTESGLNALITCNNCILKVANKTTGVTTALYYNVTAIDQEMDEKCEEISQPASPTVSVISWAEFYPHGNVSTATTSTADNNSTATNRSGIAAAAASEAASSGAGRSSELSVGLSVGLAGLTALFAAFV